jgi:type I restriction enzyme S subunit
MTDLPADWTTRPLSEIADVRLGRQRSPKNHKGPQMRQYLRAANVGWAGLKLNDIKSMNFSDLEMGTYRLSPGDLVMSEASGSPGEVGKPALWSGELDECAFQNTLIRIRSYDVEPHYLLHYFRFVALTGGFTGHAPGVGIHHLGRARIAGWSTPVPPPDEQRRIVDILEDHLSRLDAADQGLKLSIRRVASYEAAALSRCRDGDERPLSDVTEIQGGIQKQPKRAPKQNAYPFLRVANVTKFGLDLDEVHSVELFEGELDRLRLQRGDLLVVEGNGSASQIGRAALWDGSIEDCVHQNHLIRVRPKSELSAPYLEAIWNSPQNRRQLTDLASSSSGLHTLSVSKLKSLKLPMPSMNRQRELVAEVQDVRDRRRRLDTELDLAVVRAQRLRRSLLAAAFSGRLTGRSSDFDVVDGLAAASG